MNIYPLLASQKHAKYVGGIFFINVQPNPQQ